ncbi:TPA: 30S ribosomal protein S4 [Streptococcus pneumoniae]|nr:30S ribosomal protein S4 [Streptococcus pneumoniae]
MSRYTGPSWKQARRLGLSLTGTGKELARRNYVPGQHGPNNRSKLSEYGLQLAEKQKLRFTYGVGEKQFRNLFVQATKIKGGILGFNFMLLLERRLDNVVYRLGLATTRRQARQFVNHGHILVDGKRVDIPSYRVTPGQVISVREKSLKVPAILEAVEATLGRPAFVSFDAEKLEGSLTRLPERDEINPEINEVLVVEFYNKML